MPNPPDQNSADPRLDALLDRARQPDAPNVDDMWARLRRETLDATPTRRPMAALADRQRADKLGARVRGALLLIGTAVAASVLYYIARRPAPPATVPSPIVYRDFETKRGMRAIVNLSDGSRVVLAPQSRLRVPETYGNKTRDVELHGEAIFDVAHDSLHGFHLKAGEAELADIGTRFDARAYDSTGIVTVAVASGSVSIIGRSSAGPTAAVAITRGQVASLRDARISAPALRNLEPYFKWETDQLSFDRQSLREVLATLSRWYDLDITVADPALLDRRVTAEFSTQRPSAMLEALAAAVGAKSVRHDRHVVLASTSR